MSPKFGRVDLCSKGPVGPSGITSLVTSARRSRCNPLCELCAPSCRSQALIAVAHQWQGLTSGANQLEGADRTTAEELLCRG